MNEIGFENLVNEGEPEQSINSVLNAGVEILVVTLADKGCTIYTKSGKTKVDGISVPVVDVTGAGDTFNSSFVYAYLKSRDIFLSGEFANYAAAASITEIGARAGSKGLDHVLSFIQSREIDISRFKVLER